MIVVFAIDALEYNLVEQFNCTNLKQQFYGKTDISEFSEPRTMVLWSSFMTGKNMEAEILAKGDIEMWNTRIPHEETFFSEFKDPVILDLPGYNYDLTVHEQSRKLLKAFFETEDNEEKEAIRKQYNRDAFDHHRYVKNKFKEALKGEHDFVLGYFSVADVVGHLNFGNNLLMKMIYKDLDEIASQIDASMIVLSDHGMERIGMFGDHSNYGFWSSSDIDIKSPRISDFPEIIKEIQ